MLSDRVVNQAARQLAHQDGQVRMKSYSPGRKDNQTALFPQALVYYRCILLLIFNPTHRHVYLLLHQIFTVRCSVAIMISKNKWSIISWLHLSECALLCMEFIFHFLCLLSIKFIFNIADSKENRRKVQGWIWVFLSSFLVTLDWCWAEWLAVVNFSNSRYNFLFFLE